MILFSNGSEGIVQPFAVLQDLHDGSGGNPLSGGGEGTVFRKGLMTVIAYKPSASVVDEGSTGIKNRMSNLFDSVVLDV